MSDGSAKSKKTQPVRVPPGAEVLGSGLDQLVELLLISTIGRGASLESSAVVPLYGAREIKGGERPKENLCQRCGIRASPRTFEGCP